MIYQREEFVEENATDQKFPVKQVERLTSTDGAETKYVGRLSMAVRTPMGATTLPVAFEIDAANIEDAFQKFEPLADAAVEEAKKNLEEQLREMRQKSQSRIVTPGEMGAGGMGRIQM